MDHEALPPTPMPVGDDPFRLTVPFFPIPDAQTLQLLMAVEQQAMQAVHRKAMELQKPGLALVDPSGKPILDVAVKLHEELTAYTRELLSHETIAEEWAKAPSLIAKRGTITTTSFQIAILTYQELSRIISRMTPEFASIPDAVAIGGLNALHHQIRPLEAFKRNIKAQANTQMGKVDVMGQDAALLQRFSLLEEALYRFLRAKGLLEETAPDTLPTLTMEGVALLKHLLAVLGSSQSMQQQGPALAQQVVAEMQTPEQKHTKTIERELSEINRQLEDPDAEFPEA